MAYYFYELDSMKVVFDNSVRIDRNEGLSLHIMYEQFNDDHDFMHPLNNLVLKMITETSNGTY
jgi:hypothetical protein